MKLRQEKEERKGKGREGEGGTREEEGGREQAVLQRGCKARSLCSSAPSCLLSLVASDGRPAAQRPGRRKTRFRSQGLGKGAAALREHRALPSEGNLSTAAVICIEEHVFYKA